MRLRWTSALSVGALALQLLSACAARSARPEHPASAAAPAGAQARKSDSKWREMTWAEYYADVMERARRRGVMVVWINPPPVEHAPPAADSIDNATSPPAR